MTLVATLAPNALTTPARVRELTGCSESDAQLIRKINSISGRVQTICGRKFHYQAWPSTAPLLMRGNGSPELWLPVAPIRTVSDVILNGFHFGVQVVDSTVQIPLHGQLVFRTREWDEEGKLYCPMGFTCWAGQYMDLTNDVNMNPSFRFYNLQIAMTAGYITPQFDRKSNPTYNPDGLPCDLPEDLEEAVCVEVDNRFARPNRQLVREITPGGYQQQWTEAKGEFAEENMNIFLSYRNPGAIWA